MLSASDTLWFLWATVLFLVFVMGLLIVHYATPPGWHTWFYSIKPRYFPTPTILMAMAVVFSSLNVPAFVFLNQDDGNMLMVTSCVFALLHVWANFFWVFALFVKKNIVEAGGLVFASACFLGVVAGVSWSMGTMTYLPAGILTAELVFFIGIFILHWMMWSNESELQRAHTVYEHVEGTILGQSEEEI